MKVPSLADLKAWAGLAGGMAGAGLQHQLVSDSLHFDCRYGHYDLPIGIAALVLIAAGALVSWSTLRAGPSESGATRRFVARMSLMAAMLFALMVLWGIMAGAILPACP